MKSSAALAPAFCEAARVVASVAAGRSLSELLERGVEEGEVSRAALIDLTHGTLRRYGRVQAIVAALSRREPDAKVAALLWCAIYALESGRYADYTVVDQAVRATGLLECWNAKSYVNAVLRGYLRQRPSLEAQISADPQALYQHPRWWLDALQDAYPDEWQVVAAQGNAHPPMCLRVNRRRTTPSAYAQRLEQAGVAHRALSEGALLLAQPLPVQRLPGFNEGEVSVQDAGAQRAARCLDLRPGLRVLDACAAPGGKSAHILESEEVELTAVDVDPARCERIRRNLDRLGLKADVRAADATRASEWWHGEPFDRVLADVPCTASGIARRHPDLKWLRRESDLAGFAGRQGAILDSLWRVLRPGGKLLYVTCSVFPQENEAVIAAFAARVTGAMRLSLPDGAAQQWLPDAEHDGFYYSLLQKQA
jgi:16S rRNA (cytosine967-C5)-methyltransferase